MNAKIVRKLEYNETYSQAVFRARKLFNEWTDDFDCVLRVNINDFYMMCNDARADHYSIWWTIPDWIKPTKLIPQGCAKLQGKGHQIDVYLNGE